MCMNNEEWKFSSLRLNKVDIHSTRCCGQTYRMRGATPKQVMQLAYAGKI